MDSARATPSRPLTWVLTDGDRRSGGGRITGASCGSGTDADWGEVRRRTREFTLGCTILWGRLHPTTNLGVFSLMYDTIDRVRVAAWSEAGNAAWHSSRVEAPQSSGG